MAAQKVLTKATVTPERRMGAVKRDADAYQDLLQLLHYIRKQYARRKSFAPADLLKGLTADWQAKLTFWDFYPKEWPEALTIGCEELAKSGFLHQLEAQRSGQPHYCLPQ